MHSVFTLSSIFLLFPPFQSSTSDLHSIKTSLHLQPLCLVFAGVKGQLISWQVRTCEVTNPALCMLPRLTPWWTVQGSKVRQYPLPETQRHFRTTIYWFSKVLIRFQSWRRKCRAPRKILFINHIDHIWVRVDASVQPSGDWLPQCMLGREPSLLHLVRVQHAPAIKSQLTTPTNIPGTFFWYFITISAAQNNLDQDNLDQNPGAPTPDTSRHLSSFCSQSFTSWSLSETKISMFNSWFQFYLHLLL